MVRLDDGLCVLLSRALADHVAHGKLRLVILNGCKSNQLAKALYENAGVECVVAWETCVNDEAGKIFGEALALGLKQAWTEAPHDSGVTSQALHNVFDKAKKAVTGPIESSVLPLPDGTRAPTRIQKFKLVDPEDKETCSQLPRGFKPAGIPALYLFVPGDYPFLFVYLEGHLLRETGDVPGSHRAKPCLAQITGHEKINPNIVSVHEVDIGSSDVGVGAKSKMILKLAVPLDEALKSDHASDHWEIFKRDVQIALMEISARIKEAEIKFSFYDKDLQREQWPSIRFVKMQSGARLRAAKTEEEKQEVRRTALLHLEGQLISSSYLSEILKKITEVCDPSHAHAHPSICC